MRSVKLTPRVCAILIWLVSALALPFISQARQQDKSKGNPTQKMPCEGGLLNKRVTVEARPVYPAAAREKGVAGNVAVRVWVDEEGKVYKAVECMGPRLLLPATIDAAYDTRLSPTLISGTAVKVSGLLLYVFKREEATGKLMK